MSIMYLIRHGQVLFNAKNHDHLSPLGELQSDSLSRYFLASGTEFDAVYVGSQNCYQQTAGKLRSGFHQKAVNFPKSVIDERLNELHQHEIFSAIAPDLAKHDETLAEWLKYADSDNKTNAKLLKACFHIWQNTQCKLAENYESWAQFCQRVDDGISDIQLNHQSNQKIAIITSAGVIARTVQLALQLPDAAMYALIEPLTNGSVTACYYGSHALRLHYFNDHSHLLQMALDNAVSYR